MHLSNVKNVWNERGETKNEFIRIFVQVRELYEVRNISGNSMLIFYLPIECNGTQNLCL